MTPDAAARETSKKPDSKENSNQSKDKPVEKSAKKPKFGCFFKDGIRRVDYIVVWEENLGPATDAKLEQQRAEKRRCFEENLIEAGVDIERETTVSTKKKIHYLKLFVSWQTMCHFAEYLGFAAPLQVFESKAMRKKSALQHPMMQEVPDKPRQFYTSTFSFARVATYVGSNDQDTYFRPAQRFEVAYEILGTRIYGKLDMSEVGINRMINEGIYSCAFPPHDGTSDVPAGKEPTGWLNPRQILHHYWARWNLWYKYQPLHHIRDYFGEKIAFYFAFVGFYTTWLAPACVAGIGVFIYSYSTVDSSPLVIEACSSGKSIRMCPSPRCSDENLCPYWYLSDICTWVRMTYIFDNSSTVLYSLFVSFWACIFLEAWKRKSAALAYQWDVIDFGELQERPRPEYEAKCTERAEDPVTRQLEPHYPFKKILPRRAVGVLSVVFMMCLSMCSLMIMIVVRNVVQAELTAVGFLRTRAQTMANLTSALLNLLLVLALELIYEKWAISITEWEMHRTQTQFENSLILKVFIFEIFNYYLTIAYTALVKGKISSLNIFSIDAEVAQCNNGNCMLEVTQMIAVVIIGKQMAVQIIELLLPKLLNRVHRCYLGVKPETKSTNQWEADHALIPYQHALFLEYLEMTMQFGSITLFVPAFPLAPVFALVNNLTEIRLDARKLVLEHRRPTPERSQSIGVWFNMLKFVVSLSTVSNSLLMAFTSEFLPTLVYGLMYDEDWKGYKNFTLPWAPVNTTSRPCRLSSSTLSAVSEYDEYYWKVFTARIIFAIGCQQFVVTLTSMINYLIPDMPGELDLKIKRQKYLAKQALLESGTLKPGRSDNADRTK